MKIGIVLETINKVGGTEKATVELANALKKRGHDITVISIYSNYFPNAVHYDFDTNIKIKFISKKEFLKYSINFYRFYFLAIKSKLLSYIQKENFDVVLFTNIKYSNYRDTYYKKILVMHSKFEYFLRGIRTKALLEKHHSKFDKIVFLTQSDKDKYQNYFKVNNATNIYNSVSIKGTKAPNKKIEKKTVVYVGRLNLEEKQLDLAIRVFDLARKKNDEEWTFKIYGEGPASNYLKKMILDEKIENVKLMGVELDMQKVFKNADINILTSSIEGLPMSIIEAGLFGVPTVSYKSSQGISEIIENEVSGYLVKLGNKEDLVLKLSELMSDSEKRNKMGNKAKEKMEKQFSSVPISIKWENLFESLLSRKGVKDDR